jgi:hypothetical protein
MEIKNTIIITKNMLDTYRVNFLLFFSIVGIDYA